MNYSRTFMSEGTVAVYREKNCARLLPETVPRLKT